MAPIELPAFQLADGSGPAQEQTSVSLAHDGAALSVRFECRDRDAWSTFSERDQPLWQEEVVEIFLAPGPDDPVRYFEIEISPFGVLFDAVVDNPTSRRVDMRVDTGWDLEGIEWQVGCGHRDQDWWAELILPFAGFGVKAPPRFWRANFFRVERPRDGRPAEFSCWSPTLTDPPDFHKPRLFGLIELEDVQGLVTPAVEPRVLVPIDKKRQSSGRI